jgi:hypothetical protein
MYVWVVPVSHLFCLAELASLAYWQVLEAHWTVLSHPFHASPSHLTQPPAPREPSLAASRELAQLYNKLAFDASRSGGPSAIDQLHSLPESWEEVDIRGRSEEVARQTNQVLEHWMTRWTVELSRPLSHRFGSLAFVTDFMKRVFSGAKGIWPQKHLLLDFQSAKFLVAFYLAREPPTVEARSLLETVLEDEQVRTVFGYLPDQYLWVSETFSC